MKTILHIISTPRQQESVTLKVSQAVIERFREQFPGGRVDTLDLFAEQLPHLTFTAVSGKYQLLSGKNLEGPAVDAWKPIKAHIDRFKAADIILISAPMWNFGMPYVLKHYLDVIVQPQHLFRYTAHGPEGLVPGKKVIVASARGGDYSSDSPLRGLDHLETHLRTILSFIGVTNPTFISVQPTLGSGPEVAQERLHEALGIARTLTFGV